MKKFFLPALLLLLPLTALAYSRSPDTETVNGSFTVTDTYCAANDHNWKVEMVYNEEPFGVLAHFSKVFAKGSTGVVACGDTVWLPMTFSQVTLNCPSEMYTNFIYCTDEDVGSYSSTQVDIEGIDPFDTFTLLEPVSGPSTPNYSASTTAAIEDSASGVAGTFFAVLGGMFAAICAYKVVNAGVRMMINSITSFMG